ncbi:MAG: hypothetical protein NT142_13850 [Planctomycetota bacterium]|nr:hypothetical protein [Planctomycetota bacterium]
MFRPFRAWDVFCHWPQGVALGYRILPRWGNGDAARGLAIWPPLGCGNNGECGMMKKPNLTHLAPVGVGQGGE